MSIRKVLQCLSTLFKDKLALTGWGFLVGIPVICKMNATRLSLAEKVAETVIAYYKLADVMPATALDLAYWLDGLPSQEKVELIAIGLIQAPKLPAFKRYVLEERGHYMEAYMQAHLTPSELTYWGDNKQPS